MLEVMNLRGGESAVTQRRFWMGAAAVLALSGVSPALADGYPPFYGYSPYFGGPATYFSPDADVQQVTKFKDGEPGFGTRTYYRGGPFWTYRPTTVRGRYTGARERRARRSVLRSKG